MAAAMELASCTVCLDTPMKTPIYQCYNGHLLCRECEPRLVNCPTCIEPLPKSKKIRNRAIEQMQPPMMCCKNVGFGCDAGFYDALDLENHNRECTKTSAEVRGPSGAARTANRDAVPSSTILVSSSDDDDYPTYVLHRERPIDNATILLDSGSESDGQYGMSGNGSDIVEMVSGEEDHENDDHAEGEVEEADGSDDYDEEESNGEESEFDEDNEQEEEDNEQEEDSEEDEEDLDQEDAEEGTEDEEEEVEDDEAAGSNSDDHEGAEDDDEVSGSGESDGGEDSYEAEEEEYGNVEAAADVQNENEDAAEGVVDGLDGEYEREEDDDEYYSDNSGENVFEANVTSYSAANSDGEYGSDYYDGDY